MMKSSVFAPRTLFSKTRVPPQLAAIRPRFLREVVLVNTKDELIIDGTSQLQILQGQSTRSVLPEIMRLLDGTRSLQEVQAVVPGVPAEHIRTAVSLLYSCGLIEDGVAEYDPTANQQTLGFFRRHVGTTGANRSGKEGYEKLQTSEVVILGSGAREEQALKSVLEQTGLGRLVLLDRKSLSTWHPDMGIPPQQSISVSLSFGTEDYEWHAKLDEWCRERRLSWLRVVVDPQKNLADIGPLFNQDNPCYRCFHAIHGQPPLRPGTSIAELSNADADFWVSMVAVELTYLVSRIGPTMTGRDFERYDLTEWRTNRLAPARLPGCLHCRPLATLPSSTRMHSAVVFEDCIGTQSLAFAGTMEDPNATRKSIVLAKESKRLPNCRSFSLPREIPKLDRGSLDVLRGVSQGASQPFTLAELSAILMLTAGIRDARQGGNAPQQVKRWSATGGNLGSVELYVAVRNVDGLPPGVYFYQPREHSLAAFQRRDGALKVEELMRRAINAEPHRLPDALLFFTGAYHRLSRKYGAFGYRLLNLDAGVALSQMHLTAAALGISSRTATLWADDLAEDQLNLELWQEQCTAVAELSAVEAASPVLHPSNSVRPASDKAAHEFCNLPVHELVQMVYRESRVKEEELKQSPSSIPPDLLDRPDREVLVSLEEPVRGGRLASDTLTRRQSNRYYGGEPVSLHQLGTMMHCAQEEDIRRWPEEHAAGLPITFIAIAWRVDGLEPGVYRYRPKEHGLERIAPAPSDEQALELFPQREFAAAPLVLWCFGNLAAACSRHGAFGHRQLLLRAGSAGHRMWMASLGMGLAGCLVAGVVPSAARRHFGSDGYKEASLLAFATGYGAQVAK